MFKKNRIILYLSAGILLIIIVGLSFSQVYPDILSFDHKHSPTNTYFNEYENLSLEDFIGDPVLLHFVNLEDSIGNDCEILLMQQISEIFQVNMEMNDLIIITFNMNSDQHSLTGKELVYNLWNIEVTWIWIDNPESSQIPNDCRSYYDNVIECKNQTFIFLNDEHNIEYHHQMYQNNSGSGNKILTSEQIIDQMEIINHDDNNDHWLENYSPLFDVGLSDNDWWTQYPKQNPSKGSTPIHPQWLVNMLYNGSILILGHSSGCKPCIEQQDSIKNIMDFFGEEIQFVDLQSGVDERANEIIKLYDPDGSPNCIPSTILLTLVKDGSGHIQIGWHSIEGATGDDWLINYVVDAIYYHYENVNEWS